MEEKHGWEELVTQWSEYLYGESANIMQYFSTVLYTLLLEKRGDNLIKELNKLDLPYTDEEINRRKKRHSIGRVGTDNKNMVRKKNVSIDFIPEDRTYTLIGEGEDRVVVINSTLGLLSKLVIYFMNQEPDDPFMVMGSVGADFQPLTLSGEFGFLGHSDFDIQSLRLIVEELNQSQKMDLEFCTKLIYLMEELVISESMSVKERDYYLIYILECLIDKQQIDLDFLFYADNQAESRFKDWMVANTIVESLERSNVRSSGQLWEDLSHMLLKYPVIDSEFQKEYPLLAELYADKSQVLECDMDLLHYEKEKSNLELFMGYKELRTFFEKQGYAVDSKGETHPTMTSPFIELYRQALADTIGSYIVREHVGMELTEPINAKIWGLSKHQLSSGECIIFKNWNNQDRATDKDVLDAIFNKMKGLNMDKIYLVNLVGKPIGEEMERDGKIIQIISGICGTANALETGLLQAQLNN